MFTSTRLVLNSLLCAFTLFSSVSIANIAVSPEAKQLDFKVFLDSKEIGYHRVNIEPTPEGELINVEAQFKVKFLLITAFSYLHTVQEKWSNECLRSITTQTTENGDEMFVQSEPTVDGLAIKSHQTDSELSGCVRSFAYWDPQRLNSDRLLNTQTGEHVPAKLNFIRDVTYETDDVSRPAKQYLLEAEDAEINLWYDLQGEWLALKTKVKGGRELAYHRTMDDNAVGGD